MTFEESLPRLVTLFDQGRLVPFVGLGLSLPTCSSWALNIQLLAAQAQSLELGKFPNLEKVKRDELPRWAHRVVSLLKRELGEAFSDAMRKALYMKAPDDPDFLTPATRALARLHWPLVLTTNYDDLLFRASYEKYGRLAVRGRSWYDCDQVVAGLTGPGPRTLWALQGFLPSEGTPFQKDFDPDKAAARAAELAREMVVGHEEYRRVTHREPWFRRAFAEVFRSRSFLFLGSGLAENYLIELFGEALEMTGMSPYPHFALIQQGEVDPDFLRNRLNILVIEYPKGRHEVVTDQLNTLADAVDARRVKPMSLGFSFRAPARLAATPDVPDFLIVRGELPNPGDGECVGISCGRHARDDGVLVPLVGGNETHGVRHYLIENQVEEFVWLVDTTLGVFRRRGDGATEPSPFYGLVARRSGGGDNDIRDLRIIPQVCRQYLDHAAQAGFHIARLMIIAGGPKAPFPPLHAGIQMARGLRDWFRENPQPALRVVVHIVDPSIWFNIGSGRLNLQELLTCDTVQAVVLVQNPDGSASRQYRLIGPKDTAVDLARTVHVPLKGWMAAIHPSPVPEPMELDLGSKHAKTTPLFDLGVIPGSTIRFAKESPWQPSSGKELGTK